MGRGVCLGVLKEGVKKRPPGVKEEVSGFCGLCGGVGAFLSLHLFKKINSK
jgi:hypothetical protein